jgi:predicted extracellular nuclease
MSNTFRVASFNTENLFERSKLFDGSAPAREALGNVMELNEELARDEYDKAKIEQLYGLVADFVEINEVKGKLFSRGHVVARGRAEWVGWIAPKQEKFDDQTIANTARVVRDVDADVLCLVEVESLPALRHFSSDMLHYERDKKKRAYPHAMLIDSKDPRGIDLGLLTQPGFKIGGMWSHVDEGIFSRDCPEMQVALPNGETLWMLLNHFKSKGYGSPIANDQRRAKQASRVAEILTTEYNLKSDLVVVAGDLNDTRDSEPLKPLMQLPGLVDILALAYPDPADRWTYHYKKNEQIDYMLVSEPLAARFQAAGVERRGIYGLARMSARHEEEYDTVTCETNSASDHGAVWADFAL